MEKVMSVIKKIENILEEAKASGQYWEKDVPIAMMKMDIELNKIIENYIILSKEEQKMVGNDISVEIAWLLLNFSTNMATYSLRLSEQRYFTNGLWALGMVLNILDQREVLIVMPLYYDVSKQNKWSFEKILKENNKFSNFVKNF